MRIDWFAVSEYGCAKMASQRINKTDKSESEALRKPEQRLNIKPPEAESGDRHMLAFNISLQKLWLTKSLKP